MNVIGVILGGGAGTRLHPLTVLRAKPAVPLAGKYRLVDIPISNCINSDICKIYLLTQYNSSSLHYHVQSTFQFDSFSGGFVRLLAAEQTPTSKDWFQGTADAVRQSMHHLSGSNPDLVVVLSGDQLYRIDFKEVIAQHVATGADVTVCTKPVPKDEAVDLGVLEVDPDGQVTCFKEKPGCEGLTETMRAPLSQECFLASMGIYIFNYASLKNLLNRLGGKDFGKHIIPKAIKSHRVFSYIFHGYWKDIGTIGSFWKANLELTDDTPPFTFYNSDSPIYTRSRFLPPSKVDNCVLKSSLIAEGAIISSAEINRSIIGLRSMIKPGTIVRNSIIMGNDFYEKENLSRHFPAMGIGRNCKIENAILDKNVHIGDNVTMSPFGITDVSPETYCVRDGVIVIPKGMKIADNTVIGNFVGSGSFDRSRDG